MPHLKYDVKEYDKDFLLKLLKEMILIRNFEDLVGKMYKIKKIMGFCHLYTGQEALCSGSIGALELGRDFIITAYRCHGHTLSCGIDPKVIMAEMYGKSTGLVGGIGGSMHMFSKELNHLGGHGIVGGQIPIGTGAAFSQRYFKNIGKIDKMPITLCYFGDGAIHQGSFHESLNMAKIWKLPIIYILENNAYAMGTSIERSSSVGHDFIKKAAGYGMKGIEIDANDVLEVYETIKELKQDMEITGEPVFIDAKTYRFKGHSISDPQKYRSKDEIKDAQKKDPIERLALDMIANNLITEQEYKSFHEEAKIIAKESADFAEKSPEPTLQDAMKYVLA